MRIGDQKLRGLFEFCLYFACRK